MSMRKAMAMTALLASAVGAAAGTAATPSEKQVVQAQGQYARAQLESLAVMMSAQGAAFWREALRSGNAQAIRSQSSPAQGWPARGPSLGEALPSLLANTRAQQKGCESLEGACQQEALHWGESQASLIMKARDPGAALRKALSQTAP